MSRRTLGFALFAGLIAAGCIRLGLWQLSRLDERRTRNREVESRLQDVPIAWSDALRDVRTARYRTVHLRGVLDYDRELVLTSRTRRGAPGVHVLTPLHLEDGSVVLVNRGWVYSPDGTTIDFARWREGDSASVSGYLEEFESAIPPTSISTSSNPRAIRRLLRDSLSARLGADIAPVVVVQRDGAEFTGEVQHPFRVDLPLLNDGAHKSYAIQWFSFAAIAVVGTVFVLRRGAGRTTRRGASAATLTTERS